MTAQMMASLHHEDSAPQDSEYAAAARHLAGRLVSLARPDGRADEHGSPAWTGDELDPTTLEDDQPRLVHRQLDETLLSGRAGVALALAVCADLPYADPSWREIARMAAAASLRKTALADHRLGWDGALGTAHAAAIVGQRTGDSALVMDSQRLAGAVVRRVVADPAALPDWPDLLGGLAGVLCGVTTTPLAAGDEPLRAQAAAALVARLDEASVPEGLGRRWLMATTDTSVVGLAHGASGIALALSLAASGSATDRGLRVIGNDAALDLAAQALAWEDSWYDVSAGGWPDLRFDNTPGLAWCHGAPGVGVVAALQAGVALDAHTHARFVRARAASALHQPSGTTYDGTLCHGLGGVIEMHLLAAQAWPASADEHLREARKVAGALVRAGQPGQPTWQCGILNGGRSPNLLVGLAGVAMTLARCHDPAISPSPADPTLGAWISLRK